MILESMHWTLVNIKQSNFELMGEQIRGIVDKIQVYNEITIKEIIFSEEKNDKKQYCALLIYRFFNYDNERIRREYITDMINTTTIAEAEEVEMKFREYLEELIAAEYSEN